MIVLPVYFYVIAALLALFFMSGIRFIPNNRIGVIEKRFASKGSIKSGFIAKRICLSRTGHTPKLRMSELYCLIL